VISDQHHISGAHLFKLFFQILCSRFNLISQSALFYLKGVSPPEVGTIDIYRGVVPFIAIQVFVLVILIVWPELFGISSVITNSY